MVTSAAPLVAPRRDQVNSIEIRFCAQMLAIDIAEAAGGHRDLIERTVVAILLEREVIDHLLADRDRATFGCRSAARRSGYARRSEARR